VTRCVRESTSKTGMVFRHIMQLCWNQRQWFCVLQAELQRQRSVLTQFRKDVEYMDGQSRKVDAQREKQLALPKPVSIEEEAKKAVEHAKGLTDKERKDFARALSLRWHPGKLLPGFVWVPAFCCAFFVQHALLSLSHLVSATFCPSWCLHDTS